MQQLLLDIAPDAPASLEQFIAGDNQETLNAVRTFAGPQHSEPLIYLWGTPASGKTFLLQACVKLAREAHEQAMYLDARDPGLALPPESGYELLALDNVEHLSEPDQIALFLRINRARDGHGRLLCAGNTAPMQLPLRADLTSRLGWHLVYQLHPLSETARCNAVTQRAHALGFELAPELMEYLMRHWRRDLPALLVLLERLDRYSRQQHRPVTLPLLREVLADVRPDMTGD